MTCRLLRSRGYSHLDLRVGFCASMVLWIIVAGSNLVHQARLGASSGTNAAALALGAVGFLSYTLLGGAIGFAGWPLLGPLALHLAGLGLAFVVPKLLPGEWVSVRSQLWLAALAAHTVTALVAWVTLVVLGSRSR
jgi:hypothetical protein